MAFLDDVTIGGAAPASAPPAAPAKGGFLSDVSIGTAAPIGKATSSPAVAPPVAAGLPAAAPIKPAAPPSLFSKFSGFVGGAVSKASDAISKFTSAPDASTLGTNAGANTLKYLPSELARAIPGVKEIQDDPSMAQYVDAKTVGSSIAPALADTAKGLAKAPITGAADVWDAARIFAGKNPNATFDIPVLGKVTSDQLSAVDLVNQGENPWMAALKTSPNAIFNGLFLTDILLRVAAPRAVKTSETTGNLNDVALEGAVIPSSAPKTGRLYEPATTVNKGGAQVLPSDVVAKMRAQGIEFGAKFDPTQPTFFRVTVGKAGAYTGEIVQIKPSYLQQAFNTFKGKQAGSSSVPALLGAPEAGAPSVQMTPVELAEVASNATPKDVTVVHSQTVTQTQVEKGLNETLTGKNAPEAAAPAPEAATPSTVHAETVAHNILRLGDGDVSKAKEGAAILHKEIKAHIAEHGIEATREGLVNQVGVDPAMANNLVREAQLARTPAEMAVHAKSIIEQHLPTSADITASIDPKQPTRLSNEEANPIAERAADVHWRETQMPAIKEGKPIVIGADDLKDHFANDYNDNNHGIYSRAAFLEYERALKESPVKEVVFTGGGPASGKTEIITKMLLARGYKGIIYDSNMANLDGVKKQIDMARAAGFKVTIKGVLPNLEKSRTFSIQRGNRIGRHISDATFARGHAGFPKVAQALLEEGYVAEDAMHIFDTRDVNTMQEAVIKAATDDYIKNPLAILRTLGYDETNLKELYGKEQFDPTTGIRRDATAIREGSGASLGEHGSDTNEIDGQGDRGGVLESGEGSGSEEVKTPELRQPMKGFVNPGAVSDDVVKLVKQTTNYIDTTNKNIESAKDLDDTLYKLGKNTAADLIESNRLINQMKIVSQPVRAEIDAYRDAIAAGLPAPTLSEEAQNINNTIIDPLLADASKKRAYIKGNGIELPSESYNPRIVKGRGGPLDRIVAAKDKLVDRKGGGKKSNLAKSAGSLKSRVHGALTDENGNRIVTSEKAGRITAMQNRVLTDLGPTKQKIVKGQVVRGVKGNTFIDKTGKKYSMGEATKAEIEKHTSTRYYHDPIVSAIFTHEDMTRVYRAVQVLEGIKNDARFNEIAFHRDTEGLPPDGWKPSPLDQFRNYYFEPKTWKALNAYKNDIVNEDPLPVLTFFNNLALNTMFLSPVKHFLNVGAMATINRGAVAWLNPLAYPRAFSTSIKAIGDVATQSDDFLKVLREGAPFMSAQSGGKTRRADILENLGEEIDPFTQTAKTVAKVAGAVTPFHWVHALVWPGTDMFMQQGILEGLAKRGLTVQSATSEQIQSVIEATSKIIPDYRLPIDARQMPKNIQRNLTIFLSWRLSLYRNTIGLGKSVVTGDQGFKDSMGSDAWKARAKAVDKVAVIGLIALFVIPYLQQEWQKITKNPDADIAHPSIFGLMDNVNKLATGQIDIGQYIQTIIDFPPATKELLQQALNLDLFTGQHIRDKNATFAEQWLNETPNHIAKSITVADQYSKLDNGSLSFKQFLESLVGLTEPDKVQVGLVKNVTAQQTRLDKLDKGAVGSVQAVYDAAKAAGFGTPAADELVNKLSAPDYLIYKQLKAIDNAKQDVALKEKVQPIVEQAYQLGFGTPEADALTAKLSDDEMRAYNAIKTLLYGAKGTGAPAYAPSTMTNDKSIIGTVAAYASAIHVDPMTAFERIFTNQRILRTENGTIIVERNDVTEAKMRKQLGATTALTLDHIASFELGGDNSAGNMWLVPKDLAAQDDKVENLLGKALADGKINGKEAREYELRYKKNTDAAEINSRTQKLFDSVGSPLTLQEIQGMIQ